MSATGQQPTRSIIRSMPGNAPNGHSVVSIKSEAGYEERYQVQVSKRKYSFSRSVIQSQVKQILTSEGPKSTEKEAKQFALYTIDTKAPVYQESNLKMYRVRYAEIPEYPTMVRIYSLQEMPPTSMYLKILRHLGRKQHKLVFTLDIFVDATSVYIFQEYVSTGNMVEFLEKSPIVSEAQAAVWAKQLFEALDFLADQGLVHRSITPNHLLVKKVGAECCIKLTGFKQTAIYLGGAALDDIAYLPCWPASQQPSDGPNFQAPEVYGNPSAGEHFNPLLADIWSFGANVYFFLAKQYPYNIGGGLADIDAEVLANIHHQLSTVSGDGQNFLYSTMRANANNRMPFHFIVKHPWMHSVRSHLTTSTVMETPYKRMEKVKVAKSGRKTAGKGSVSPKTETKTEKSSSSKHRSPGSSSSSHSSGGAHGPSPKSPKGGMKVKTKIKVKSKMAKSGGGTSAKF